MALKCHSSPLPLSPPSPPSPHIPYDYMCAGKL